MLRIYSPAYRKILQIKDKFKKEIQVRVTNKGKIIELSGNPENEYVAEKVIEAINFGFPIHVALLLTDEDYIFEHVPIKSNTKSKNLERIRARIIGTHGKTLKTLANVSSCFFELKDNNIGIIGPVNYIQFSIQAIHSLIKGAKQANVYNYLEKYHPEELVDIGLKEKIKNKKSKKE